MKRTKKTLSSTEIKQLETTELAATTGGIINGIDEGGGTVIHFGLNNGLLNGLINGLKNGIPGGPIGGPLGGAGGGF